MRRALAVLALVALAGCAETQPYGTTASTPALATKADDVASRVQSDLANLRAKLQTFSDADFQRALDIVTAAKYDDGIRCVTKLTEIKKRIDTGAAGGQSLVPIGGLSLIVGAQTVLNSTNTANPVAGEINSACAAMVSTTITTLAKLGLIAVPGGGAAGLLGNLKLP